MIHDGTRIPTDPVGWDPDQTEWVTMAWGDAAERRGGIAESEWVVPEDWEVIESRKDVTAVGKDGTEYPQSNQALLRYNGTTKSQFTLTNRVTFGDDTILDRSVNVRVTDL